MTTARRMRNIENVRLLAEWPFLEGAFGTGNIWISDCEFLVERNGHFLYGEIKNSPEELARSIGQGILLKAISRLPEFTVFAVTGRIEPKTNIIHPQKLLIFAYDGQESPEHRRALNTWHSLDESDMWQFVHDWYVMAEKFPSHDNRRLCPACRQQWVWP